MSLKLFVLVCYLEIFLSNISNAQELNVIDKNSKISALDDKQWLLENIPFVEIPDKNIEEIYYYRWSTHKRHLRYLMPGIGYMVTEFLLDVGWQDKYAIINDAAGHHIYESRWLRNQKYVKDYINIFSRQLDRGGNHHFSEWIADSVYNAYLMNGDKDFITSQLDGLVAIYNLRSDQFEPKLGLYYLTPAYDAQEYSAASVQTTDRHSGGLGYRPSWNSEMYGNAVAISKIAQLAGNTKIETEFKNRSTALRQAILTHLWDKTRTFFYHVQREQNPNNTFLDTREEVGFFPWRYRVPDDKQNYSLAFDELFDPKGFDTKYGPSTCETRSKWYEGNQKPPTCCSWDGNSWPYSTSHILKSLAVHLREYSNQNTKITVDSYFSILQKYALTQYKNNKPYVAECHSPSSDVWVCDSRNHSEHYAHSTYTDNVLNELLGILPQEDNTLVIDPLIPNSWNYFAVENVVYKGNNISIVFDRNGDKYKVDKGLTAYANGAKVGHLDVLGKLKITVPEVKLDKLPIKRLENYASNPANRGFPRPSASFTDHKTSWEGMAVDGRTFYDPIPSNHWSNTGSNASTDWFAVDFGRKKNVNSVNLYIYSDISTNGKIDCPSKMTVQYMNDKKEWIAAEAQSSKPAVCAQNNVNIISFNAVNTQQLRVEFTRKTDHFVGITEMEVWADFPQTPSPNIYEAEDGYLTGYRAADDVRMESSETASGHSYVGGIDKNQASVELSGISVAKSGDYKLRVFYANSGTANSTQTLIVNRVHNIVVTYPPTKSGWGHFDDKTYVELTVPLLYGNNVLIFQHSGSGYAEIDKIEII